MSPMKYTVTYPLSAEQIFCYANPLTAAQQKAAYNVLTNILTEDMAEIFREAIRYAHDHWTVPVTRQEFWENVFVGNAILQEDYKRNILKTVVPQDPYEEFDIQACLKYLYYGGGRILSPYGAKPVCYTQDQESFFQVFDIDHQYQDFKSDPLKHFLYADEFSRALSDMIALRNKDAHTHTTFISNLSMIPRIADIARDNTPQSIPFCVNRLAVLLQPLCRTTWSGQEKSVQLYRSLWKKLYEQLGALIYPVERIMEMAGIDTTQQAAVEMLLTNAGLQVDQGMVEFCGDAAGLVYTLILVWTTVLPYSQEQAVQVMSNMLSQIRVEPNISAAAPNVNWDKLNFQELLAKKNSSDPQLQYRLGLCYRNGNGTKRDDEQAFKLFYAAANQGNAKAMVQLGLCWETGIGTHKCDWTQAVEYYRQAAKLNDEEGNYQLGRCYEEGIGMAMDAAVAMQYYKIAAENSPVAQVALAKCYASGVGVKRDVLKAVDILNPLQESGMVEAKLALAELYEKQWGAEMSREATQWREVAFQLYREAANGGSVEGEYHLGRCFHYGIGVPQDLEVAVEWYERAAQKAYIPALIVLMHCYQCGVGIRENVEKAAKICYQLESNLDPKSQTAVADYRYAYAIGGYEWYQKAAQQQYLPALVGLGRCYETGHNVEKDMAIAVRYYRQAADAGYAPAMCALANCYEQGFQDETGQIVPPKRRLISDRSPKACAWYEKAAALEDPEALFWLGTYRQDCAITCRDLFDDSHSEKAFAYLQRAAQNNCVAAQISLAELYMEGYYGVIAQDTRLGAMWYARAAKIEWASPWLESTEAMYQLAKLYVEGTGMKTDMQRGIFWYRQAAAHNHEEAMYALARLYEDGWSQKHGIKDAMYWYKRAAHAGHAAAAYKMGLRYSRGGTGEDGLPAKIDLDKAVEMFRIAAEDNHPGAIKWLKERNISVDWDD